MNTIAKLPLTLFNHRSRVWLVIIAGLMLTIGRACHSQDNNVSQEIWRGSAGGHGYIVTMTAGPFRRDRHRLAITHPGGAQTMYWIDGKPEWKPNGERSWHGTDGGFPGVEIYSFNVRIDGQSWAFPKRLWKDCFEPGKPVITLSRDGKRLRIDMVGSDGAGNYEVIWDLRANGRARRHFAPTECGAGGRESKRPFPA